MKAVTLVLASVRFYWRTHLGVVLGAALATLVLTGSLLVGDSVTGTLRRQALARVGKAAVAVTGGDHFFRAKLADELAGGAAPVLALRGSVALTDGAARINQAQVLGVEARFWALAPGPAADLPPEQVALNERAAAQLGVQAGSTVIVRVEKPGFFSKDAPLSGEENEVIAIRATVGRVVSEAEFGRFGLQASQTPPMTVFLPLTLLQSRLAFPGNANLLLRPASPPEEGEAAVQKLQQLLNKSVTLADEGLQLRKTAATGGLELRSPRVFLDPPIVAAAPHGVVSLTYLVNELRAGARAVPYSMVTAVDAAGAGFLPADLAEGQIVINQWLADQLMVGPGGRVTLKYFVMGERRQLTEQAREFSVVQILPMDAPQLDGSWMPDFPGLADKKNCRDWQPGFAMDTGRIRPEDEAYWQKYRGTPKAFISLAAGQEMWGNRWGAATAIRYPATEAESALADRLRLAIPPQLAGLTLLPLRAQALAATQAPVDFGELFVSFSFFLIVAAAVLTGLLFVFSLEQRNAEAGLLLALGWRSGQVRRLFLAEGAVLALVGALLGSLGAVGYTQLVLHALAGVWSGAVGAVALTFSAAPATLPTGLVSGMLIALLAIWLASRRQLRRSARDLLAGGLEETAPPPEATRHPTRGFAVQWRRFWSLRRLPALVAASCLLAAVGLLVGVPGAEGFFGAGSLLLLSGLALSWLLLRRAAEATDGLSSVRQLGLRNAARRRGRSLATIAVLASGVFIVVAVNSFRHAPLREGDVSDPGTGGFALVGDSALPIYEDLSTAKGREAYGLDEKLLTGATIVPFRVHEGDEASCLNLNRALQPRLLGVRAEELAARGAFLRSREDDPWQRLIGSRTSAAIPGVADAATLEYSLQKKVGEALDFMDERGQPFQIRLAGALSGSILQGSVILPEHDFVARFPSAGGYRFFLIACPPERVRALREHLSRQLSDRGLALTTTTQRLGEFQAVENAYLSIFQALGGLGLLLGSAGLAIVVGRNVLERRREFGLLAAVGFQPRQLRELVFAEHAGLIAAALGTGAASALLAVWPALGQKSGGFPWREIGGLLGLLLAGSLFWTWLATRLALRGSGVAALRSE